MKKSFLLMALLCLFTFKSFSQVKDITITVSPVAEYTWWSDDLTLDNSTF